MLVLRPMNWIEISPWLLAERALVVAGRTARTGWDCVAVVCKAGTASRLPPLRHAGYFLYPVATTLWQRLLKLRVPAGHDTGGRSFSSVGVIFG
jgi:hypothetical protein